MSGPRRAEGRGPDELRPLTLESHAVEYAEGSCLVTLGDTRVLCAASVEESVPRWRKSSGHGWVTAEYAMLPRSTHTRTPRERAGPRGRTQEIQRIIGRSLRSVTDLSALGPRTVTIDCDVLQADGGTRTAGITGGWVALSLACARLVEKGEIPALPMRGHVAAVSTGIVDGVALLDLDYSEDSSAQVDMNVVATDGGDLVEIQGTAELRPFNRDELAVLLELAFRGIEEMVAAQTAVLA